MKRAEVPDAIPSKTQHDAKLRILMVAARFFPSMGGTESHIYEVGRRLVARGHEVCILTADTTGILPQTEQIEGMTIVRVRAWLPQTDVCLAPGLATQIDRSWDIVHVQGYHTFSAPFSMLAALIRKLPFVLTFHSGGHSSRFRNRIRQMQVFLLRPLVRRATRLVAVSHFEADSFSRQLAISRSLFTVIPNGASLPAPAPSAAPEYGRLIISLGRLERYKGHHRVIEAFADLRRGFPGATLRILGEGPYKQKLLALVCRLKLEGSVIIGSIPAGDRQAMANLLARADLVVLLSEYEAHPVAVMEALSLGVPVLTSNTSGFRELAERRLVTSIPIEASRACVTQAMADRLKAARSSRTIALPGWDDCTEQLLSVYRAARRAHGATSPAAEFVE